MRSELSQWLASPAEPLRAAGWNGWLNSLEKLMPAPPPGRVRRTAAADHPFRVEAARWDNPVTLPINRVWRVDVSAGCCNDQPATILYRRKDDPRQWSAPGGVWITPGLPLPAASTTTLAIVDRSLLEADAPFLLVITPAAGLTVETAADDFRTWKGSRPTFFQREEYLKKNLWYADVTLIANPLQAFQNSITGPARAEIAAKLPERFRLRAGRAPVNPADGVAGGNVSIACLWLVRDPHASDVLAADEILVQQRVYTHLQALIVAPGLNVDDGSIIGALVQEQLDAALAAAAGQEFWSG